MNKKIEYRKHYKELYMPKTTPNIIDIPNINFLTITGEGDPNKEPFAEVVEALYAFSYAVKMSYKSNNVPEGYYDYTVFPLEGVWDLIDKGISITNKDNFKYTMMIRQPDFLTDELFERFLNEIKSKKKIPALDRLKFENIQEGLCCQIMHIGSYDDEPKSFETMENFCIESNYKRISKLHREIYLSDPRKIEKEKMKTVLRFKIEKNS